MSDLLPGQLLPPDLQRLMGQGEVRQVIRGPRSVGEILTAAREAGDEQDRQEAMAADPFGVVWPYQRRRRSLWQRLLHGR